MYLDAEGKVTGASRLGPLAAGIPGTVAGMALAHKRFGKLEWHRLVAPAITLAHNGHVVDQVHARIMERGVQRMRDAGYNDSARHYENSPDVTVRADEHWYQPELAKTLRVIAEGGADAEEARSRLCDASYRDYRDSDLGSVQVGALDELPKDERAAWRELWSAIEEALAEEGR